MTKHLTRRRAQTFATVVTAVWLLALYVGATAQDRVTPADAAKYIGKTATVCGQVAGTTYAVQKKGRPTFINLDRPYPNQIFTALIWGADRAKFSAAPEKSYSGKKICVTGTVSSYRGVAEIMVRDPSLISVEK